MENKTTDLPHTTTEQTQILCTLRTKGDGGTVEIKSGSNLRQPNRRIARGYQYANRKTDFNHQKQKMRCQVSKLQFMGNQKSLRNLQAKIQSSGRGLTSLDSPDAILFQSLKNTSNNGFPNCKGELKSSKMSKVSKNGLLVYSKENVSSLPVIKRPKPEKKIEVGFQEVNLVDFGIFSERRGCQTFMRRFKNAIEKEFVFESVDINNSDDVLKLQFLALKEIHSEGHWMPNDDL